MLGLRYEVIKKILKMIDKLLVLVFLSFVVELEFLIN